jgi:hypothetical protein
MSLYDLVFEGGGPKGPHSWVRWKFSLRRDTSTDG